MPSVHHASLKSAAAIVSGLLLAVSSLDAAPERPNILFILSDDQRDDTLGCAGHPVIRTPTIDSLAARGVRFANAYVNCSVCMASRATIFTGLTRTGHGYSGGGPPAIPLQPADVDTSFPVLLRDAGYRTGYYGKQHVKFAEGIEPALKRMFDDHRIYGGGPHFVEMPDGSTRHTAELIGDRAAEFIGSQPADRPFCLYMSFNIAHARDGDHRPGIGHFPWPRSVDGMYEDIDPAPPKLGDPKYFEMQPEFLRESLNRDRWYWRWDTAEKYRVNMRAYYRMLTGMDRVIARVRDELADNGFAENTVILFAGDNGYYMGNRGFAGKWSHYEESLRVPTIIYDPRPGAGAPGRVPGELVTNVDLAPTILDLAGLEIPDKYQGASLTPFVRGETPAEWRADFFTEHHAQNPRIPKWRGVHGERHTYARYYQQEPVAEMLYDLETDPDQLVNLADDPQHAALLERMRARTDELRARHSRPEIERLVTWPE